MKERTHSVPSKFFIGASVLIFSTSLVLNAQVVARGSRPAITERVDAAKRSRLHGNTRPEANAANDIGAAPEDLPMEHMMLQLQRPAEQEQALQSHIRDLHDSTSPSFHKWMTPAEFGAAYGPAQSDVDTVVQWLNSEGFQVNAIYPNRLTIDFTGTVGQIAKSFHTSVHYLHVNGVRHLANMSDPEIPAALAPVVAGVVSMHDFKPHAMRQSLKKLTYSNRSTDYQALTPGDLAAIYNLNPLFASGITGKGQTIALVEDADIYNTKDWDTFRSTLGLSEYTSGSLVISHPAPASGGSNCTAPGTRNGGDDETTLDAEWASASAPDATIMIASCSDTRTTFGGLIALQNLINGDNPPSVVSMSYGECESYNGAASNAAFLAAYQQAVAEGISVFVSAGDEGAASCDSGSSSGATHGITVSGFASTPYNVAVGGTDFGDSYAGNTATYWSSTNSASFASALSYIPEIPWNDNCGSQLLATSMGFPSPYGSDGLCASSAASQGGLRALSTGSGGPSGCATGTPSTSGTVSGTCKGYGKPAWQAGVNGIPNDGVRDIPDVSLFAGTGAWGHYYVFCYSNTRNGGTSCTGDPSGWAGGGGTSFSAPILAGVQALVNQKTGSAQGNPNPVYYRLAANSTCDSSAGDNASSNCIFHNVTQGDIAVNCGGSLDCFGATSVTTGSRRQSSILNGLLSTSSQNLTPAYGTAAGWNFATGLGTLNVANLVNNWQLGQ
jgi:subtilase family serine protease